MDFVDNEHASAHGAQKPSANLFLPICAVGGRPRRAERVQEFAIDIPLQRFSRHLHRDDRHGRDSGTRIE